MVGTPSMTREQLESLGEQIANLSLRIDIAKHTLLTHLREFDAHDGWGNSGFISLAAWLSWRIGIQSSAAREYVRVARALGEFRRIDAAFAAGDLSYSKVRAITRVASPATEQGLIDIAMHATAAQVERICAGYRRTRVDPSEPPADLRQFMRRSNTASGMVRIELQLTPEHANVVWEAMNAALDAGRSEAASAEASLGESGTPAPKAASAEARGVDPVVAQMERADAMVSVAQSYLEQPHRTLGSGYELVMMSSPEQLEQGPGGVGGFLRDGTPVPLHLARMLACDCARVDVQSNESGEVLDVGRARRTIPNAIHRALWIRDGGCRVPGCGRKRHVHAHHLEAWAEGGETKLSNLALLCPFHHALVHEGNLRVEMHDGKPEFRNIHGLLLKPVPERGEFEAVARWLESIEPELDGDHYPKWDGSRLDLDEVLSWMFRAEARAAAARVSARRLRGSGRVASVPTPNRVGVGLLSCGLTLSGCPRMATSEHAHHEVPTTFSEATASAPIGSKAQLTDDWSGVWREGYGSPDSPSPDVSRERLCNWEQDTCSGSPPWLVVFGGEDHAYRVVMPQADGRLALSPVLWEHGGKPQCIYRESPQLRVDDGEVVLSIRWEGNDPVEVCEPRGCTLDDMDCDCYFDCLPTRRGVCDLVLEPETLSKREQRGDCSGPPPM